MPQPKTTPLLTIIQAIPPVADRAGSWSRPHTPPQWVALRGSGWLPVYLLPLDVRHVTVTTGSARTTQQHSTPLVVSSDKRCATDLRQLKCDICQGRKQALRSLLARICGGEGIGEFCQIMVDAGSPAWPLRGILERRASVGPARRGRAIADEAGRALWWRWGHELDAVRPGLG
jgi:hypothetical protein